MCFFLFFVFIVNFCDSPAKSWLANAIWWQVIFHNSGKGTIAFNYSVYWSKILVIDVLCWTMVLFDMNRTAQVHLLSFLSSVWRACWAVFRATCHPSAVRFKHCSSSQSVWTWGWRTVRPSAVSSASWLTNWSFPAPWFRKDTYWACYYRVILLYSLKS